MLEPIVMQKQGHNECKLATLAMILNVPLSRIRSIAEQAAGCAWSGNYRTMERYNAGIAAVAKHWNLPRAMAGLEGIKPDMTKQVQNADPTVEDLIGRGELDMFDFLNRCGHAVAYQDGMIYDPNLEGPYTLQRWLALVDSGYYHGAYQYRTFEITPMFTKGGQKL